MEFKFRKRKQNELRKLIKTDASGVNTLEAPVYVKLCEVEDNILEDGTPLTKEVLNLLNWKDNAGVEFEVLEGNVLPSAKDTTMQLVCKANGELWCIPKAGLREPFLLGGIDLNQMLHSGVNFLKGAKLQVFNLNNQMNLFATTARIGAIQPRDVEDTSISNDTYMEISNAGKVVTRILGEKVQDFTDSKLSFTKNGSTIRIDSSGRIYLEAPTSPGIFIKGTEVDLDATTRISFDAGQQIHLSAIDEISLSSSATKVQDSKNNQKFNCFTDYLQASYGSQKFRLQFYENYIRIMDVLNDIEVFRLAPDGKLLLRSREVITSETISTYMQQYFQSHIEAEIKKYLPASNDSRTLLYEGAEVKPEITVNLDSSHYQFFYSLTETGEAKSIICRGNEINTNNARVYNTDGYYYKVCQVEAENDWEDSYIEITREDVSGSVVGHAYVRAIYKL